MIVGLWSRKTLKLMAVTGLFAAALTLTSTTAQAGLILNGGFESTTGGTAPGQWGTFYATSWTCAGPNCANGAVSVFAPGTAVVGGGGPVYPGFPDHSPASGNFLGIDPCFNSGGPVGSPCSPGGHSSVVYQEVNTPGGLLAPGTYVLNFWQAGGQWNGFLGPTTTQWEVGLGSSCLLQCGSSGFSGIGGEIQFSQAMVNSPGGNGTTGTYVPWELETLSFTVPSSAAGTPQYLSFVPIGNIAVPPVVFLDDVDLEPAPELSTLLTLGVGLLGLSIVGLRRRVGRGPSVICADIRSQTRQGRGKVAPDGDGVAGACRLSRSGPMPQFVLPHLPALLKDILRLCIGLAVPCALFLPLERVFALHRQKVFRKEVAVDIGYYFVNGLLISVALSAPLGLVVRGAHHFVPSGFYAMLAELPVSLRAVLALVVGEVGYYWGHRLSHEIPFLWRFHAVHHSAGQMDFLVSSRGHPVDLVVSRLSHAMARRFTVLGESPIRWSTSGNILVILVLVVSSNWSYLIHANVRWAPRQAGMADH